MNTVKLSRLGLAVMPAMVVPCLGVLLYFVAFKDSLLAKACYGVTKAFTVGWPLLATWFVLRDRLPRPSLPARKLSVWRAGALSGAAIVAVLFAVMRTPVGEVVSRGGASHQGQGRSLWHP